MELLTPEEVAAILRVTPYTIRKMLREGRLPGFKVGPRQWRIRKEDLEAYLQGGSSEQKPASP